MAGRMQIQDRKITLSQFVKQLSEFPILILQASHIFAISWSFLHWCENDLKNRQFC